MGDVVERGLQAPLGKQRLSGVEDPPSIALGVFAQGSLAVDGAIVGFRSPDQVDPILGAANLKLTAADLEVLAAAPAGVAPSAA